MVNRKTAESSKIRWSDAMSDVVHRKRAQNGGQSHVCFTILAGLTAAHPACYRLFFWFFPVTSPSPLSTPPKFPSEVTLGIFLRKVWLFNFPAAVCQTRNCLCFARSFSSLFSSRRGHLQFPLRWTNVFSCQVSYRMVQMAVELLAR